MKSEKSQREGRRKGRERRRVLERRLRAHVTWWPFLSPVPFARKTAKLREGRDFLQVTWNSFEHGWSKEPVIGPATASRGRQGLTGFPGCIWEESRLDCA